MFSTRNNFFFILILYLSEAMHTVLTKPATEEFLQFNTNKSFLNFHNLLTSDLQNLYSPTDLFHSVTDYGIPYLT